MRYLGRLHCLLLLFASSAVLTSFDGVVFSQSRVSASNGASQSARASLPPANLPDRFAGLPLAFEQNRGQSDSRVLYFARGSGYTLFLTANSAIFSLNGGHNQASSLAMRFAGISQRVEAQNELPGKSNYFVGSDPAAWYTNVPNYARVEYHSVHPGVDLVYYGTGRQLEQDWVVAPGTDPRRAAFELRGAERLSIDPDGSLVVSLRSGKLRFEKPAVYQMAQSGRRLPVEGRFALKGRRRVGFTIGPYDRAKALVIDPELIYSTYLGGSDLDEARAIAVDSAGEAYIAGDTASTNFPVTAGAFQPACKLDSNNICERAAFISKFSADGTTLLFSTYLGGSGSQIASGIALDSSGNAYVTGQTTSATDFPTANAFQSSCALDTDGACLDAFVSEIASTGSSLIYSTYLGGNSSDTAYGIAVDFTGSVYVAGQTSSTNFPTTKGVIQTECGTDGNCNASNGIANSDAFVSKFSPALSGASSLLYSTYLGGSGVDYALGLAVDSAFNAYITGTTSSTDLMTTPGVFQPACKLDSNEVCEGEPFVAKLNSTATALGYLTYVGGSGGEGGDTGNAIALDASDNAYVAGQTASTDFPVTAGSFQTTCGSDGQCNPVGGTPTPDAFVFKLNSSASELTYSTYLGGSGYDFAAAIALDSFDQAYVTGGTYSTDFPVANALSSGGALAGGEDAFVTVFNATGASPLVLSTYLGGTANDNGYGISLDPTTNIYVAGSTQSTDFPTLNPFQAANAGNGDGFVAEISQATAPVLSLPVNSLTFGNVLVGTSSSPMSLTLSNTGTAGLIFTSFVFGGTDPGDFSETNNCLDTTIAPGASCTVNVTFKPAATGARSATITANSNASNGDLTASLSGTGVLPTAALTPSSLTFADQVVNTTSAAQTLTLSNSGTTALAITSIVASAGFAQTNTCGASVAAGASCSIVVTFTPTAGGLVSGTVTVTDDSSTGSTQTATLTGTGVTAALSVTPASLTFISQTVGTTSAAQNVTVKNIGTVAVTISSVAVTGADSGDFTITQCPLPLAVSTSCTIAVTFHPAAAGTRTASMVITSSATPSTDTVSLSGTGVQPAIVLNPTALNFGSVIVKTPAPSAKTITVTNTGSATVTIPTGGITVTGADAGDFSETNTCGSTLTSNASCTISVSFTPQAGGTRTATVNVSDSSPGSPQTASLQGQGADFTLSFMPNASQSVNQGMEAVYDLFITPVGGFNQTVTLTCTNVPQLSTCNVSPSTATPTNGITAVSVSVDVFTTAPSATLPRSRRVPPFGPAGRPVALVSLLGLLALALLARKRGPRLALGLALLSVLAWASCGNSTAGGSSSTPTAGTAAGTYMFNVSGTSGTLGHSIGGTLTVN
jgi:Beta-propeller repeat/Abnormal spindle-like microcephaly-assoc'd, ASPM-SPD-2-Hydin